MSERADPCVRHLRIGTRWVAPAGRVVTVVEPRRKTRGGWVSFRYDGDQYVSTMSRRWFLFAFRPEATPPQGGAR